MVGQVSGGLCQVAVLCTARETSAAVLPFSFLLAGLLSGLSAAPSTAPCICVGGGQKRECKAWKTLKRQQYNLQG